MTEAGTLVVKRDIEARLYLPLIAAIIGFTVTLLCLRLHRHASRRVTAWAFGGLRMERR